MNRICHILTLVFTMRIVTAARLLTFFFAASAMAAPILEVDSETHDFGKSYSGAILKHTFTITNTGDEDLLIMQVVFSCGCTSTTTSSAIIAPGEKTSIPIILDTISLSGPVSKYATIQSNAPSELRLAGQDPSAKIFLKTLTLTADLATPIQVSPVRPVFQVPMGSDVPHSITLTLHNQTGQPITLSDPVLSNPDHFSLTIKEADNKGDRLAIFETIPPYPGGGILTEVTLKTSSPEAPLLRFQVTTLEQPVFTIAPHILSVPSEAGDSVTFTHTITNTTESSLALRKPTSDIPGLQMSITEVKPGIEFQLVVTATRETLAAMRAGTNSLIRIPTTSSHQPELLLPITLGG